jgi:hypothetical protein
MAENLNFYLVVKNQSDLNFKTAYQGCVDAAQEKGDNCYMVGPREQAHPRQQAIALDTLLALNHADGIAISVINTDIIQPLIEHASIPIITFDSPLRVDVEAPTHVGVDDLDVGHKLAELVNQDFPEGGSLCIMMDRDVNLSLRVEGLRRGLSRESNSRKLSGEYGWTEDERCPWYTADNPNYVLSQLKMTLESIQPTVFVSVGHWPVYYSDVVKKIKSQYLAYLSSDKTAWYVAIGKITPEYKQLLAEGYVQGYVEIDFYQQGCQIYHTL